MAGETKNREIREIKIQGGREVQRPGAARGGVAGDAGEAPSDAAGLGRFGDLVGATLATEVRVDAARGASSGSVSESLDGVRDDTVLQLELEGGVEWWTTAGELAECIAEASMADGRGGEDSGLLRGILTIPQFLPFGDRTRGGGGLLLRVLRRFDVDPPAGGAKALARRLEDRLDPAPGLYRCPRPDGLGARIESFSEISGRGPVLILLHGTASSTEGSFGAFGTDERLPDWSRLQETYGDRILAFQHRTLSQTPGENALELARLLPQDAEIHLVSHSRGGLIGELLCRGSFGDGRTAFSDAELELFSGEDRRRDRQALRDLRQVLEEKAFRIERFVRVACPARGTLLVSRRLDRYLSLMLNALGLAVGSKLNPAYQFLKALLIGLVKTRTDPTLLPGLEAMMPGSPLIKLLNLRDGTSDADLTVIAGDVEGSGVLNRLKVFATDMFFRHDHDLVVDSASMFGGAQRSPGRARYFFEKGSSTHHFNYFSNASTSAKLVAALRAEGRKIEGFESLDVRRRPEGVRGIAAKGVVEPGRLQELEPDRPVVILLPGIMGSRLKADDNVIWADLSDLLKGRFTELARTSEDRVSTAGLLERGYRDLARFLAQSYEVVPFAYDWRQSLNTAADELAGVLEDLLQRTDQPIRLLAHSMGGLVARRLRSRHEDLWKKLGERPGFRLVMLGTPNGGSHSIAGILLGREKVLRFLTLVGPRKKTRRIIGDFPGIFDMLPSTADALDEASEDLYKAETWSSWRKIDDDVFVPSAEILEGARSFRSQLDQESLDDKSILYVAGQSAKGTPVAVRQGQNRFGRPRLELLLNPRGDGRVLWDTGIPEPVKTGRRVWYAAGVSHGALANEERIFPALRELLEQGRTSKLDHNEPQLRGVAVGARSLEEPVLLPDDEDLVAAALGYSPRPPGRARGGEVLRVMVTHGSLSYARGPVAVGHYERDLIVGAESFLDFTLGGRLRERHSLGLYPGAENTGEAILDANDPTRGALVLGLGPIGGLAPAKISRGMRQAVLRYATLIATLDEWPDIDESGRRCIRLSSLLVGTGQGTGLLVDDALLAIIQGVSSAVSLLRGVLGDKAPYVGCLEFIELYEHRAVCATEALQRLASVVQPGEYQALELEPLLQRVEGGQSDITCSSSGWYRRLQIVHEKQPEGTSEKDGFRALRFTSLTERARAEVLMLPTQRKLVDRFVQHSIGDSAWRPETARTLFELLVPNQLKEYAPDDLDLLLVLDEHSASYPWELIADGLGEREPLSVRAGMLRQLASETFREQPVAAVGNTALVVGDPPTGSAIFPPLPGARREAQDVASELRSHDWKVNSRIGSAPEGIISALFAEPYRLLHIAAHGTYDPLHPEATGVVLAEGMLLTAAEIGQLRQIPELAFINCCHLGRIESPAPKAVAYRNRIAANLGLELIRIGVRAVVIAGWVVDDGAADTFASTFYSALLEGEEFGNAVKRARRATYRYHPETNTWGAYQCYGDPSYSLAKRQKRSESAVPHWVAPVRPIHLLRNIRSRARTGSRAEDLRREVEAIETALVERYPSWMQLSQVREALGRAWAELADLTAWTLDEAGSKKGSGRLRAYDRAVENLRIALRCEDGEVGFNVRGELANLEVRGKTVAWRLRRRPQILELRKLQKEQRSIEAALGNATSAERPKYEAKRQRLEEQVAKKLRDCAAVDDKAASEIEGLLQRLMAYADEDSSSRRWTMVGSASKRKAAVCGGTREAALEQACEAYIQADELSRRTCGHLSPYPAGNWALLKVVMHLADGRKSCAGVVEVLDELEAPRPTTSFWDRLMPVQVNLIRVLMNIGKVDPVNLAPILAAVRQAGRRGPSIHQFALLLESLDTLSDILDDRWQTSRAGAQRLATARRLVRQIRSELATRVAASRR